MRCLEPSNSPSWLPLGQSAATPLKHGESRQACWRTLKRARKSANPTELYIPEMEEEGPGGRGGEVTGSEGWVHFSLWRWAHLGVSLGGSSWQEVRGTDWGAHSPGFESTTIGCVNFDVTVALSLGFFYLWNLPTGRCEPWMRSDHSRQPEVSHLCFCNRAVSHLHVMCLFPQCFCVHLVQFGSLIFLLTDCRAAEKDLICSQSALKIHR